MSSEDERYGSHDEESYDKKAIDHGSDERHVGREHDQQSGLETRAQEEQSAHNSDGWMEGLDAGSPSSSASSADESDVLRSEWMTW